MLIRSPSDRARFACLLVLIAAGGFSLQGCSSGVPYAEASLAEATVTGRVMSNGAPVTKGQVIFDPANLNRLREAARTAQIRPDGTYEVTTLIGENRVTVAVPGMRRPKGAPYLHQICKVQRGPNTFDITVP
jgi:hypothetical protein